MSFLAAIAVLAVLILVHEFGHFIAARSQGIHVNRFSLGFGPVLWKYQGPETEYAVRAFPLGGFVGFPDDDPEMKFAADDPNLLRNRPVLDQAIVISAGVIANLIFAYLLLALQFGFVGIPQDFKFQPGVIVQPTGEQSVAYKAGVRDRDIILAVGDREIPATKDATKILSDAIKGSPNQEIDLKIQRKNEQLTLKVTPKPNEKGEGAIGIGLTNNGERIYRRADGPGEIFTKAANRFQQIFIGTIQGFGQLITNFRDTASQVSGPVKIVKMGADIAQNNAEDLFLFAALISINLAIINTLPLPALDGGQLAFLLIEGLSGRPLPTQIKDGVMQTGLVLILGLGIFLIVKETLFP